MNKKFLLLVIILLIIVGVFFFLDLRKQETIVNKTSNIDSQTKIVYNNLSQKLIQADKKNGYYFCFNTNEYIHETKLSDMVKYISEHFSYDIDVSGPDVTFNHNITEPNQYVCYNSIGQNQSISCWNNILNPLIKDPDCISLLS
jgi:hypothetical protein